MRNNASTFVPLSFVTLALVACVGCGVTEYPEPDLSCDTDGETILIDVAWDGSGAQEAWCEIGLPGFRSVRVDLIDHVDTMDTGLVTYRTGSLDFETSGLTCADLDRVEAECTVRTPGK